VPLNFGKVSTGALNDLERVTKAAFAMTVYFGLNDEIGNVSFYDSTGQQEYALQKPYSEKTAETIDAEVKKVVEQGYARAKKIIEDNKEMVQQLATQLLEKEVIFREDVEAIFGKRAWDDHHAEEISKEYEKHSSDAQHRKTREDKKSAEEESKGPDPDTGPVHDKAEEDPKNYVA
jgi:hypothetical protein